MRVTAGLGLALATALAASPAAAESPAPVRFVGEPAAKVALAGDVNGDGHADVILAGRDLGGGAAYVVYGPFVPGTTVTLSQLGEKGFAIQGSAVEGTGTSFAGAGDVNGDGLDDVLVGAPNYSRRSGRAYVVFGRRRADPVDLAELRRDGITLHGKRYEKPRDWFGAQVAALGDIDRDGLADVGIVARGRGPRGPGSAYVVFGRRRGGSLSMTKLGRAGFRVGFPTAMHGIASAGDWNADGRPDVALIGELPGRGGAWIVYGRRARRPVHLSRLGEKGAVIRAPQHEGFWRSVVAGGRDVDGDGHADIVIGSPLAGSNLPPGAMSRSSVVWVIRGSRSRATVDLDRPGRRAWAIARGGPTSLQSVGWAVALGRVDDDRLADVVLSTGGSLAVLFGSRSHTTWMLTPLAPAQGFLVPAPPGSGGFSTVASVGDMNADGRGDLLAGAPGIPGPGGGTSGAAYLFFSP